ncbi:uncharacterized protein LOC143289464 [Babylonia areolata]|uniref:uncharacterized protein LOC143289464 n=1 Tax=Babylonia areolata TaxID=304850 RepID=UPI003FD66026
MTKMTMKTAFSITVIVLLLCSVITTNCSEEETACTTGPACFPELGGGSVPEGVDESSPSYYCCLQRNMTAHGNRSSSGSTFNCVCKLDLTLPAKLEAWALATRGEGRMCQRGEVCENAAATQTISHRFTYCCFDDGSVNVSTHATIYDPSKEEFIGCRCQHLSVPEPRLDVYLVPPVPSYNSTGEMCSYDEACLDGPALKCATQGQGQQAAGNVTFCCYGSRGMVTRNHAGLTRCTCTDEVYGAQCEATPIAIAASTAQEEETACTTGPACFPELGGGSVPEGVDESSPSYYCCLQRNMTAHGNRSSSGSTFNCVCKLDLTLPAKLEAWALATRGEGRMCQRGEVCENAAATQTISHRFTYCCFDDGSVNVSTHATIFDPSKEEFIGCRCQHLSVPEPRLDVYLVPPVPSYNSTGEMCSYDEACQDGPALKCAGQGQGQEAAGNVTFCCYGSRGMVTRNHAGLTRCTCTDEVYGAQCEATPIAIAASTAPCLTDCHNRTAEDTCTDQAKAVRCCPNNMAVVASQSAGGNFTTCSCKAQATKRCAYDEGSSDEGSSDAWRVSVGSWWWLLLLLQLLEVLLIM